MSKAEKYNSKIKHTGRQKCAECDHRSLPGFKAGHGKCAYHWAELNGWLK